MTNSILSLLFLTFLHISSIQSLTISGYGIIDLEGNDEAAFQAEADSWSLAEGVSLAKITQTTSSHKWLLGGPKILGLRFQVFGENQRGSYFERVYADLPPHTFVGVSVVFWYFDSYWGSLPWGEMSFKGTSVLEKIHGPRLSQETDFTILDGGKSGEYDLGNDHIKFGFVHSSSALTFRIEATEIDKSSEDQAFGFRELHIHLSNYSGDVPALCHLSDDTNSLSFSQCDCPINQVKDSSGTCVNCAANCEICFGPDDTQCLKCSSGTHWDGEKCNTCDLACQTCSGTTADECLTCKYAFYSYGNNTCGSTCEAPFMEVQTGLDKYCKPMCTSSQFYWNLNNTCLNKCDPPLIQGLDESGLPTCLYPCVGTNKYLYGNSSCLDTCKAPLMFIPDRDIRFCLNPCGNPGTGYLFTNGSCLYSCPPPLMIRAEPGVNYCSNPCSSLKSFLFNNGSCLPTCPAPLISRAESGVKYCYTPCPSVNDYIYDNRSCFSSCSAPLMSRTEPQVAQYCLNPCPTTSYYLYPNGSCLADCGWPLLNKMEPGVKYCFNPCPSSTDYIYPNGDCKSACPYPLMIQNEPDFNYCFSPCHKNQYLNNDQICHSSCDTPLRKKLESGVKYCETPCLDKYIYSDGTCEEVCEYPYKIVSNPSYKVCAINIDEIQINQAHSLARGTDVANTICGIGGILTGFISPGDPTSMLMWSLLKMLQFVRYIDVNLPIQLSIIFAKQNDHYNNDNGYMSSLGENKGRVLSNSMVLGRFSYYNISGNFLANYWQQLIVFGSLIVLLLVSTMLLHYLMNPLYIKFVKHIQSALKWNVILMFFCGSYGDILLYSALEFQTASFENFRSVISFIICLVMVILAVFIPLKTLFVIKTIRKSKRTQPTFGQKDAENRFCNQRVFFESYKSANLSQYIFLFLYLMRVGFFSLIIGYLFVSPVTQALLINLTNFMMMTYLLSKKPIKDKFCFYQHVFLESMLFVYDICLLILVFMDVANSKAESTRAFFGGIMVVILIVGPVGTAFLIVFKLFLRLRDFYYQCRPVQESAKLAEKSGFQFRKVKTRGRFVIGHHESKDDLNQNDHLHGGMASLEQNESKLIMIAEHPDFSQEMSLDNIPTGTFRNKGNHGPRPVQIALEKNIKDSAVQVYAKKQANFKKRRINIFTDKLTSLDPDEF